MATLRTKRKLAALNNENCEEHPRSVFTQKSNVPRSNEDYITQVSKVLEGRVTKKLSQEFSRTENRIIGTSSRLAYFIMNPPIQSHSRTARDTSRNANGTNQATNEDRTTPRVSLILQRASCRARRHETLAQKMVMTMTYLNRIQICLFEQKRWMTGEIRLFFGRKNFSL